jgi:signal transduction histidine kinase/DNA-binding NarL/FixJ family response regulator
MEKAHMNNIYGNRFDLRFNAILLGLVLLLAVSFSFLFVHLRTNLLDEQIVLNADKTQGVAMQIQMWIETRKTEIATLANTPVIRSMDWKQSGSFLKNKHQTMPWFYIFAHISPDGSYYNSKVGFAKGKNLSDRAHVKAALEGTVYASDPVNSRTLNNDIVAVTSPIYKNDEEGAEIIGVFGGMIDTKTIAQEVAKFTNGPGSYAFVTNSTGVAIAHPDSERTGNINTKKISLRDDKDPGLQAVTKAMLTGKVGHIETEIEGRDIHASYSPISGAQWYLATVIEKDFMMSKIRYFDYAGISIFIALIFILLMIFRFRKSEIRNIERQQELSEDKNRAKDIFLANMSHELRTPLNGIIGYGQLIGKSDSAKNDGILMEGVGVILSSAEHLLSLINRVLDLTKIESGRIDLDPRPVILRRIFTELGLIFDIEKARYEADFQCEISAELPDVVVLDAKKVKQIVTNVVVNAFKYGNKSEVQIRVSKVDQAGKPTLMIDVSDKGKGMTPKQVEQALVPFQQLQTASSGVGLGLSIVDKLVSKMGGTILIDSAPGRGTKVSVMLPLEASETDALLSLTAAVRIPVGFAEKGPLRILVVDDNLGNLNFMKDLLSPIGFELSQTMNVTDALSAYQEQDIDLIVTDLVMPERDGTELIDIIRHGKKNPDTPIIVNSASAFTEDRQKSLSIGANVFLPKPINIEDILKHISSLLNISYVYPEADNSSTESTVVLEPIFESLNDSEGRTIVATLRDAAEDGNVRKVKRLIDAVADLQVQADLNKLLGHAILEHDSERIIAELDRQSVPVPSSNQQSV